MSDQSQVSLGCWNLTNDSEQRWNIYNAIVGSGGIGENVNVINQPNVTLYANDAANPGTPVPLFAEFGNLLVNPGSVSLQIFDDNGTGLSSDGGGNNGIWVDLTDPDGNQLFGAGGFYSSGSNLKVLLQPGTSAIGSTPPLPGSLTAVNGTLTANTNAAVLAASTASKYLIIQNNSAAVMYLAFGVAATTANGIQLAPGGASMVFESNFLVTQSINLLSVPGTSAGSSYVIWYA